MSQLGMLDKCESDFKKMGTHQLPQVSWDLLSGRFHPLDELSHWKFKIFTFAHPGYIYNELYCVPE